MTTPAVYPLVYLDSDTEAIAVPLVIDDDVTGPIAVKVDRLICVVGAEPGRTFQIEDAPLVIGRGSVDCDLELSDVSRRHARVFRDGSSVAIEDLGSANGTIVNGAAIVGQTRLQPGDRIQIGSTILVVSRHDELEERLQQLQKLDAMGALVKGIAHDFNNVLMVVQAGLEDLGERWSVDDTEGRQVLGDMNNATTSASGLVRRLLRIGRNRPGTSEIVHLKVLIHETIAMARRLEVGQMRIVADVAAEAMVTGSRDELQQVFLNLILNARDADSGELTIMASVKRLDRATALGQHLRGDGLYVEIVVTDTGSGMDEATLGRIFEPFFTTKPSGKGTGLGLAMIYSSIRNHQGSIHAESTVGLGTTFRLLLPAAT